VPNKILHANDGSDHAFMALALALQITRQNAAELHIVPSRRFPLFRSSSKRSGSRGQ